jgi:hypothetical protein
LSFEKGNAYKLEFINRYFDNLLEAPQSAEATKLQHERRVLHDFAIDLMLSC